MQSFEPTENTFSQEYLQDCELLIECYFFYSIFSLFSCSTCRFITNFIGFNCHNMFQLSPINFFNLVCLIFSLHTYIFLFPYLVSFFLAFFFFQLTCIRQQYNKYFTHSSILHKYFSFTHAHSCSFSHSEFFTFLTVS